VFGQYANQPGNDPVALAAVLKRPQRDPHTVAELSVVDCPVLVTIGERDFAAPSDRLASAFPNGKLVTLPRTDHFATPGSFAFVDTVVSWLEADVPG